MARMHPPAAFGLPPITLAAGVNPAARCAWLERSLLSPTVGLLSRTGTAEGTCDGQKLASVPIYGTSVFVKDGDSWKLAFTLNRLD